MQTWDFWVYRLGSRRDECLEDFKQRIRRMLRHADGIRIDHIWGLFNEFYTEREDGVGKWVGAGFFPANDEEAVALGRVILTALAEVALERNALIIGENVGIRADAIKAEFRRLQKVLPNLYGYGVLGHYRQEDINPETTLDLGDTHDTAATLEDRLQLPDFTAEHWRQYQDTLRAYGKGYDGLPSFAFGAQRGLEVLQQTRMYMLSWQNPVGDRGPEARINIPNSIVGVWGYRWSRTVEEMLDIQPLGYFPLRGGRSVSLSAAIKDLAQARLSSMANLSSI